MARRLVLGALALSVMTATPAVQAQAVVYPPGVFARVARERAVVAWDAAKRTEHLVLEVEFDTDAREVALLLPLPSVPRVAPVDDGLSGRVASLLSTAHPSSSDSTVRFDRAGTEIFAADAALGAWLTTRGFADRPAIHAWAAQSFDRGMRVVALRYLEPTPPPTPGVPVIRAASTALRKVAVGPAIRLSFEVGAPMLPYARPAADLQAEWAFLARYADTSQPRFVPAPLDLWLIDEAPRVPRERKFPAPDAAVVRSSLLGPALGDAPTWPFEPSSLPTWTVLHFADVMSPGELAFDDLTFAPTEMPGLEEASPPEPSPTTAPMSPVLLVVIAAGGGAVVATLLISAAMMLRRRKAQHPK